MALNYPWYEPVEGEELEQGDLLFGCPVIVPLPEIALPLPEDALPADLLLFDVVVMTQSCDLVNEKVTDVILCPHWDAQAAAQVEPSLAGKSALKEIASGRRPRYTLLAASHLPDVPMGIRIVDCGRIFSLPKPFVRQLAASQGKRLRLCPPYREHLSQSFARFFMRVGLPQNIELS